MRIVRLEEDHALEDVTREIDIDLVGPIRMVQRFLPHLRTRPAPLIVNVSSGLTFVPFKISPIDSAAKAAVHAYTRALRAQLAGSDVRVVGLAPPLTETPFFTDEFKITMPGQKGMPVDILIRHAITGIEACRTEIRPGKANILKIASRVAPNLIFRQLRKVG